MTKTYDHGARPDVLELVSSMLSEHGINPDSRGRGGVRELDPTDFAGMLGGIDHPDPWMLETIEHAWEAKFLQHRTHKRLLADCLHEWGARRVLLRHPELSITGHLHRKLSSLTVEVYVEPRTKDGGKWSRDAIVEWLGVGRSRWLRLKRIHGDLLGRLHQAEGILAEHLSRQLS